MMMAFYLKSGDFVDIVNIVFIRSKHIIAQTMSMLERTTINDERRMLADKMPAIQMRSKLQQLLPIKIGRYDAFLSPQKFEPFCGTKIGGFVFNKHVNESRAIMRYLNMSEMAFRYTCSCEHFSNQRKMNVLHTQDTFHQNKVKRCAFYGAYNVSLEFFFTFNFILAKKKKYKFQRINLRETQERLRQRQKGSLNIGTSTIDT